MPTGSPGGGVSLPARKALTSLRRRSVDAWRKRNRPPETIENGLTERERAIIEACRPHTLGSVERLTATMDATRYVARSSIPGALAECGVWRGGSVLAMIMALQTEGVDDRDIYLFDTFEGMTAPTDLDTSQFDGSALTAWQRFQSKGRRGWDHWFGSDVFGLEQVERLLTDTGYPPERLHFVVGPVEKTLPQEAPDKLALLRLDTDWYESTRHELEHLYPRLEPGGVLIVDDYGHWEGARQAVDEYFDREGNRPLFARSDYSGRAGIKRA